MAYQARDLDAKQGKATFRKFAVESKEESEPVETFGWQGENLLQLFLKNNVANHTPRPLVKVTPGVQMTNVRDVLVVKKNDPIKLVMRQLCANNFMGCPVMEGQKYIGFISMIDLVRKVNSMFWGDTVEAWVDFWSKSGDFDSTTVDDLMDTPDIWDRDPAPPLRDDYSTFYALEEMVRHDRKRFPLLREKRLTGILTQSMLISFIRQNKKIWGTFGTTPLEQLKGWRKHVHQCTEEETAINCFNTLDEHEVGGLAIVNSQGHLVGALSSRDLRGVGFDGSKFFKLFRPVKQFKIAAREDFPRLVPDTHYSSKVTPLAGMFVTPQQTLGDVIRLMNDGNIHRIFVCDGRVRPTPIGVLSQRDVLRYVMGEIIEKADIQNAQSVKRKAISPSKPGSGKKTKRIISVD
jgi:CBS domain-containing protein